MTDMGSELLNGPHIPRKWKALKLGFFATSSTLGGLAGGVVAGPAGAAVGISGGAAAGLVLSWAVGEIAHGHKREVHRQHSQQHSPEAVLQRTNRTYQARSEGNS